MESADHKSSVFFASQSNGAGHTYDSYDSSPAGTQPQRSSNPTNGHGNGSPRPHSARKRKRSETDQAAADVTQQAGSNAQNHYPTSNPDLDSYIKSKRKPREKKACQVCRKRKVACDQQQPCLNCIERRYPELCVYEHASDAVPVRSDIGPVQHGEQQHSSHHQSILTPAETQAEYSPEKMNAGAGEMITLPRDSFEKLLARLDQFQRNSNDLSTEIRGLINTSSITSVGGFDSAAAVAALTAYNASTTLPITAAPDPMHMTNEIHSKNELTGQTVHVGGNSVPAFVMAHSTHLEELLGTNLLPAFGLENESATYPFMSLSDLRLGRLSRVLELCKTLPPEADINRYFSSFRDISSVVYPAMVYVERFENSLYQFHRARAEALAMGVPSSAIEEQNVYGKSLGWIGLLFATLASGCQCTDVSAKELDLSSRVFVCCSFECLRMTNFLSNPSLETIQTLLILGNVISNTMNAGVAWALLGMTTRLAQVLGLHRPCKADVSPSLRDERCKLAWTMMWQDSLLSLTFDRSPASATILFSDHKSLPYDSYSPDGSYCYAGCMYQVTKVGLELIQDRRTPRNHGEQLQSMQKYEQQLRNIMGSAAPHLKSSQHCQSLQEQLEHWALYLHTSYIMSEVCREALKPSSHHSECEKSMKQTCLDSLTNTVRAFLGLNRLTAFASHSWSALSRGLSSALVLGILGHGEQNDEVRALLSQLLMLLNEVVARGGDAQTELSAPIRRWIATLTKLTGGGGGGRHGSSASISPAFEFDSDDSPHAQADSIIFGSVV